MREIWLQAFRSYLRYFPIEKGKERLLAVAWKPLCGGHTRRDGVLGKTGIHVDCDLTKWIQRHIYFRGEYEPESTSYWSELAKSADVIFDLGANIGVYSLLAADANPDATIHAFEPTPEVFEALQKNIGSNGFKNIQPHRVAVGQQSAVAFLNRSRGSDGENEGMNFISASGVDPTAQVQVVALDEFCRSAHIERVDLLKMDIEGAEYDALRGAQGLLASHQIGRIFFELSDWAAQRAGHTVNDVPDLLRSFGYGLFRVVQGELQPFGPENTPTDSVIAIAPDHVLNK